MMRTSVISSPATEPVETVLREVRDRFYTALLWWADREEVLRAENAREVYRALLAGPREALPFAGRLQAAMRAANAHH